MTIAEAVKTISALEEPKTGSKSYVLAIWYMPPSGFLAAIVGPALGGGSLGPLFTVWQYHTSPEEAVQALMSEAEEFIKQRSPKSHG